MTIVLDLPEELEIELAGEAARVGLPLAEYALRILAVGRPQSAMPKTGAELVEYWHNEGLIGSRPDIENSQEYAQMLRARAERRSQG